VKHIALFGDWRGGDRNAVTEDAKDQGPMLYFEGTVVGSR